MIAGATQTVRHTETGESAYAFDSPPSIVVTQPDGTESDPESIVTVDPVYGTSALTHTLSATVVWTQAGEYTLAWHLDKGNDDLIVRLETYFAAWTDVYTIIRQKLNRTLTQLPDATIDTELARFVRHILSRYTCLTSYNALTGSDRAFFDEAMGLTVAARLRPTLSAVATGEVKRKRQDDLEIEYVTTGSSKVALEEQWAQEATEALGRVSCIRSARSSAATNFRPFRVSGPSRAAREAGSRRALIDDILLLLDPTWSVDADEDDS